MDVGADDYPEIAVDDFCRRLAMRAANMMWFMGAGTSAAAGIPTAYDMIWEFKQELFVSQRKVSRKVVADLSSESIRAQLQAHIDSLGTLPRRGDPDEYAALFEAVYPAEIDRRTYLDSKMQGAKPSLGHISLATLMQAKLARLVWTTNFDPLNADACAKVYDTTGQLTTVALDAPGLAEQSIAQERWPIEVKLHGDFRSRRLKNTGEELRHQDRRLRQALIDCCRRFGLVVIGYSGRDDSIMDAFEEAAQQPSAFPFGLFWLHKGDGAPASRVADLLSKAREKSDEVAFVRIESFDELMRDLLRLVDGIDKTVLDAFAEGRRHWTSAPYPAGKQGWPIVRLNALPVTRAPTVCRRVVCKIGGHAEVQQAIEAAGVNILATRVKAGVLAFGGDSNVRAAFESYDIEDFDLYTIEAKRLRNDTMERGLLRTALSSAIARRFELEVYRRRNTDLFVPKDFDGARWKALRQLVGSVRGKVKGFDELTWREGVGVRLDWADEKLWLLIDPRTVFDGIDEANRGAAADFARERTVKRYNRELNKLIAFWAKLLGNGGELRALGIVDGVDAVFELSPDTAYSRRVGA